MDDQATTASPDLTPEVVEAHVDKMIIQNRRRQVIVGTTGGVIGLIIVAGLGYRWWRVRKTEASRLEAVGAFGELGIELPSWLTGGQASSALYDLYGAAGKQVRAAKRGDRLAGYRQAEGIKLFWNTARNDGGAYVKTAYWLAVASRIAGSNVLGKAAARNLRLGSVFVASVVPGTSLLDSKVTPIYKSAGALVSRESRGNASLRAIAKILGTQADPAMVKGRQKAVWEASRSGVVVGTIESSAGDVATIAETARGLITGAKPSALSPAWWFWWKWGLRIGIGGAVLVGLRIAFAPQWRAARTAASSGARAARQGYERVTPDIQRAYRAARGRLK